MKTSDIKRLGEAWASVTSKEEIEEAKTDKQEDKGQFIAAAKAAKKNGEKTFTIGGKEYDVEEALDPVNDKENDKKFKDRKDKDIDNDGDVDSSDEYLHKRRAATDDAIDGGKKPAKNAKKEQDEPGKKKMMRINPILPTEMVRRRKKRKTEIQKRPTKPQKSQKSEKRLMS